MQRFFWLCAAACVLLVGKLGSSPVRADEPVVLRPGDPQLFVDDFLLGMKSRDLVRTLHQPRKDHGGDEPVIALDDEFGIYTATLEANGSIVYDPRLKKYVMFALGFSAQMQGWERARLFRFTSVDGIDWVKGDDGRPQVVYPHSREFFLDRESGTYATNIDVSSCCYDERDPKYPYQGWQWFANWGPHREGIYHMRSADGITWERGQMIVGTDAGLREQDGFSLGGAGDVTTFAVDTVEPGRYLALVKYSNLVAIGPGNRQRARAFAYVDALDRPLDFRRIERVDLVPPAAEKDGNAPHDEYYSCSAWRHGPLWLGGLKIWHGGGDHPWSGAGCAYLKLISSRDGLHWNRVRFANERGWPEVFIANGPEGGNRGRNDGGYITEFSNPPLRIGDELIFYYGCSSWGKNYPRGVRVSGGGIFRARLRPDGYVSVDRGTLVTKDLKSSGGDLSVNSVGPVSVELTDTGDKVLGSCRLDGDSLAHKVAFGGKSLGSLVGDGPFRLRFKVDEGGQLYSFAMKK